MADRMDIDALLISALYGELTPADEARLTAHLESHPADRTALADLTHTRATVRESRILTVQFEPPHSVSALLLQEAARRAPKPERRAQATAGWFHRFLRSFMLHPAMAAAAMLVLVVGVAGTLYVRGGAQFAETTAPASSADKQIARGVAEQVAPAAPASAPEAAETGRLADTASSAPADRLGAVAGSAAYRVGLDEPAVQPKPAPRDDLPAPRGRAKDEKNLLADGEVNEAKEAQQGREQADALEEPAKPAVRPPAPKLAKKAASTSRGIELRSPEPVPKDFDDEKYDKKDVAKRGFGNAESDRASATAIEKVAQAPGAAPAGGGGATAVPSMMPQQNHAPAAAPAAAPVAVTVAPSTPSLGSYKGSKSKAPAKVASRPTATQGAAPSLQPPPPPPAAAAEPPSPQRDSRRLADKPVANLADAKPAEEKTAEDKALADWAQKQREQVLAFVKANNCRAAANAAVAIYNRAPDFYATSIATDREIRPCLPYVNNERERVDRSRAASKRVNAAETPAQAAPPPARK